MALSSSLNRKVFVASAGQTAFAFGDVLYFDQSHLTVYVDGVLKSIGTHYTVSPTTNTPNGTPGGTVTFLTPMVGSEQVVILRVVPIVQSIDYQENEKFPADTHERGLDWLTMVCQQFNEKFGRQLALPVTSTKTSIEFPDLIAANAGRGVRIKADLTGLEAVDLGATPYSSILTVKGDLATYASGAQARLPVGADNKILVADSALTAGIGYKGVNELPIYAALDTRVTRIAETLDNPIINGSMDIWQRSSPPFVSPAINSYTADRWSHAYSTSGAFTIRASSLVPTVAESGRLFPNSLEVEITTADTFLSGADYVSLLHKIEGMNWIHFARRQITLSFWVMATKVGVYSVGLVNNGGDRSYVGEYTVNASDTWEYKTITVAASPSEGGWNYSTSVGLSLYFVLMAGSNWYQTAGSWTWTSATPAFASPNQVNALDSTANFFRITGVRMNLGAVAFPIAYTPFEVELGRCERYYQKSFGYTRFPVSAYNFNVPTFTATKAGAVEQYSATPFSFTTRMRSAPMLTFYNPVSVGGQVYNYSRSADHSLIAASDISESRFTLAHTGVASTAVGDKLGIHWAAQAEL